MKELQPVCRTPSETIPLSLERRKEFLEGIGSAKPRRRTHADASANLQSMPGRELIPRLTFNRAAGLEYRCDTLQIAWSASPCQGEPAEAGLVPGWVAHLLHHANKARARHGKDQHDCRGPVTRMPCGIPRGRNKYSPGPAIVFLPSQMKVDSPSRMRTPHLRSGGDDKGWRIPAEIPDGKVSKNRRWILSSP